MWENLRILSVSMCNRREFVIKKRKLEEWRTQLRLTNSMPRNLKELAMILKESQNFKKVSKVEISLQ